MTSIYAPTTRARRVFIAVLAFALAIGFAFVASIAPADARKDALKYQATVDDTNVTTSVTVIWKNVSDTDTQLAGSFSIGFPPDTFVGLTAGPNVTSPSGTSWVVLSSPGDNPVVVSAASGGNRIAEEEQVSVLISWTDAPPGDHDLASQADQQAGGVFKPGGNQFKLDGSDPTITVCGFALCGAGFVADVVCDDCELSLPPLPDISINGDLVVSFTEDPTIFILTVTTTEGKAGPPGGADVEVLDSTNPKIPSGTFLPSCGLKGAKPVVNCFHVNRVPGGNLEYTVIFDTDPRFKFR